jgi:chitinase
MKQGMLLSFLLFILCIFTFTNVFAVSKNKGHLGSKATPQPSSCINSAFSQTGNQWWSEVTLKLTNNCGRDVDFRNTTITYNSSANINTHFWGDFNPLHYPDNNLQITSQEIGVGNYLASLSIHIQEDSWANSILPVGRSIAIRYGIPNDVNVPTYDASSVKVYVDGAQPVQTGEINLTNITAQPSGVNQSYAMINVLNNGQVVTTAQLPWAGMQKISNLAPGNYTLAAENVTNSQGILYQGTIIPVSVAVVADQKVNSTVSYAPIYQFGKIKFIVGPLPSVLAGYTVNPLITLTKIETGSSVNVTAPWNTTTTVDQLINNSSYSFSTPMINFNGQTCVGSFIPATLMSSAVSPLTSQLSYSCSPVKLDKITLNVTGLPTTLTSLDVTFTPSNGTEPVTQKVDVSGGHGSGIVNLIDGVIYNVSASSVSGYNALFNPQPLTASAAAIENITYQQQSGGRIIGYLPGWKTPPSATALAQAGYTHVMVAFGVFSTTTPGKIVSAFDTITKNEITLLHNAGIKVILSLGGASTSIPETTVSFHQVLQSASSPAAFQQTMVQSIKNFMTDYGFDGIDIDIEDGLGVGGTFTQPTGDIAVLANILKQLHNESPNLLITLTPQVANISATSGFDATWGNYASLIMQTHTILSWVEIQLYNTGCAYGIDKVCYDPNATSTPNFSVAMATDLLANWPEVDSSGRKTGFQPYISYLTPSQVVIGYPAPNAQGVSDGAPVTPNATIKRAIQCLRTAVAGNNSCGSYVPPQSYPGIGGVFNWEVTYDQSNNFKFAKDLKACVIDGNCN